ncbi:hypothetical protein ACFX1X_000129 [Malus domestica]
MCTSNRSSRCRRSRFPSCCIVLKEAGADGMRKKKPKKKKQGRGKIPSCRSKMDEYSGAGTNESASRSTLHRFFRLKTKPSSLYTSYSWVSTQAVPDSITTGSHEREK